MLNKPKYYNDLIASRLELLLFDIMGYVMLKDLKRMINLVKKIYKITSNHINDTRKVEQIIRLIQSEKINFKMVK
jgi:hypothetical protein